jgi:hypothetical protein
MEEIGRQQRNQLGISALRDQPIYQFVNRRGENLRPSWVATKYHVSRPLRSATAVGAFIQRCTINVALKVIIAIEARHLLGSPYRKHLGGAVQYTLQAIPVHFREKM